VSKTSLRLRYHQIEMQIITKLYFQHRMRPRVTIPEVSLNIQDFSSVRLHIQGMAYPQKWFRRSFVKKNIVKFYFGVLNSLDPGVRKDILGGT
jgi:hypothetical protein